MVAGPAPGFVKHPDHRITLESLTGEFAVHRNGRELLRADRAVLLRESRYPPVLYLPFAAAHSEAFVASPHSTWCPFKGHARYWHLRDADGDVENAVWGYPEPFDEVADVLAHVAFYPQHVDLTVDAASRARIDTGA